LNLAPSTGMWLATSVRRSCTKSCAKGAASRLAPGGLITVGCQKWGTHSIDPWHHSDLL